MGAFFACSHRSIQALGGLIHLFVVYVIVDVFVTLDVVGGMVMLGWCRVHKTLGSRDPDPMEGFSQVRKVWA